MSLAKLIGKFQNADKNNGNTNFISLICLLINDKCTIKKPRDTKSIRNSNHISYPKIYQQPYCPTIVYVMLE